jgi:uncharacterized protein YkwD
MKWLKVIGVVLVGIVLFTIVEARIPSKASPAPSKVLTPANIDIYTLHSLVNATRKANSLAPLALNPELTASAQAKCDDMATKGYWSDGHNQGLVFSTLIKEHGQNYTLAGENLAKDMLTPTDTLDGWMKSTEHKKNILEPKFASEGLAVCNYTPRSLLVVQHFTD